MNPKLQKLRAELEKNTEKIEKLQSRNTELKKQIQELENIDIIYMVRECYNGPPVKTNPEKIIVNQIIPY